MNVKQSEIIQTHTIQLLNPDTSERTREIMEWIENFIAMPHPSIGRNGAICPFVRPSIKKNVFFMVYHDEIDGSLESIVRLMYSYKDIFVERFPPQTPEGAYSSLLVVFPNISEQEASVVDKVAEVVKSSYVQSGLMIGEFHPNSTIGAARNPDFHPMTSPYGMLAIRNMALHDILFLHQRQDWFYEFDARFGKFYQDNSVSNSNGLVTLYHTMKERYSQSTSVSH